MFPNNKEELRGAERLKLKVIFKKVQDGCKIRRAYRIFGYTRRDKLFIAFEADRFNHSRTCPESSYQPSALNRQ